MIIKHYIGGHGGWARGQSMGKGSFETKLLGPKSSENFDLYNLENFIEETIWLLKIKICQFKCLQMQFPATNLLVSKWKVYMHRNCMANWPCSWIPRDYISIDMRGYKGMLLPQAMSTIERSRLTTTVCNRRYSTCMVVACPAKHAQCLLLILNELLVGYNEKKIITTVLTHLL